MTILKRNSGLDVLRILCCIMVIFIHVIDEYIRKGSFGVRFLESFEVCVFLNAASRAAVPVFIMISGLFLLDEEREVNKEKIEAHICKIVKAFIFGTLLYSFIYVLVVALNSGIRNINWIRVLKDCITGPFHFWYLFLIVGLYLITPILREITKKDNVFNMYMILSFIFSVLLPSIWTLPHAGKLQLLVNKAHLNFLVGYQFYYMLGWWLKKNSFKFSKKPLYVVLYFLSVLVCSFATIISDNGMQSSVSGAYLDYFFITTFVEAVCLFAFFYNLRISIKMEKYISKLSNITFGIYILHLIFIKDYAGFYIIDWGWLGQFKILGEVIIIFILCLITQICLNALQKVGKCALRKE